MLSAVCLLRIPFATAFGDGTDTTEPAESPIKAAAAADGVSAALESAA